MPSSVRKFMHFPTYFKKFKIFPFKIALHKKDEEFIRLNSKIPCTQQFGGREMSYLYRHHFTSKFHQILMSDWWKRKNLPYFSLNWISKSQIGALNWPNFGHFSCAPKLSLFLGLPSCFLCNWILIQIILQTEGWHQSNLGNILHNCFRMKI